MELMEQNYVHDSAIYSPHNVADGFNLFYLHCDPLILLHDFVKYLGCLRCVLDVKQYSQRWISRYEEIRITFLANPHDGQIEAVRDMQPLAGYAAPKLELPKLPTPDKATQQPPANNAKATHKRNKSD